MKLIKPFLFLLIALVCIFTPSANLSAQSPAQPPQLTAKASFSEPSAGSPDLVRSLNVTINDTDTKVKAFLIAVVYGNPVDGAMAVLYQTIQGVIANSQVTAFTSIGVPSGAIDTQVVVEPLAPTDKYIVVPATY